ncbi:hypothetical protein KSP40_PGU019302 [Platanthera guangdongensis]|uniref:Uncharacterized protein n=1 Tax=Platanthera guangdongensis TaxID=2320717 RepID=A0ABR2N3K3_9ASPA
MKLNVGVQIRTTLTLPTPLHLIGLPPTPSLSFAEAAATPKSSLPLFVQLGLPPGKLSSLSSRLQQTKISSSLFAAIGSCKPPPCVRRNEPTSFLASPYQIYCENFCRDMLLDVIESCFNYADLGQGEVCLCCADNSAKLSLNIQISFKT